jgi:septal ring-binding cell division protein DamX
MAGKDKSVLDKFVDSASEVVGSVVKAAVTPTVETDQSRVAGAANERVYIPEATDAAAMPAPIMRRRPAKRANKRTAKAAPAKKAKTAKKAAAKRTAPKKSKSSAGRKAVGRKKTAKKAAKKKARKSRR